MRKYCISYAYLEIHNMPLYAEDSDNRSIKDIHLT